MRSLALTVALIFSTVSFVTAQKTVPKTAPNLAKEQQEKTERFQRFQELLSRARRLTNLNTRVSTIIALAKIYAKHDKEHAVEVLVNTFHSIPLPTKEELNSQPKFANKTLVIIPTNLRLRYTIKTALMQLAPDVAKKLSKTIDDDEIWFTNLRMAENAAAEKNLQEAKRYWLMSLKGGVNRDTVGTLQQLRAQNAEIADELYLLTLAFVSNQPQIIGELVAELGNYCLSNERRASPFNVIYLTIGRVGTTVLTYPRKDISETVLRGYLQFAFGALNRQIIDPKEKEYFYVTAFQLLPHIKTYTPELELQTNAVMQRLLSEIPPIYADEKTFWVITKKLLTVDYYEDENYLKNLEKTADSPNKDLMLLQGVSKFFQAGNTEKARQLAEKIQDISVKSKIDNLLAFAEAKSFLKDKDFDSAELKAGKMSNSLEKTVLLLNLAEEYLKSGRKIESKTAVISANKSLGETKDEQKIPVLLKTADLYAQMKDFDAFTALGETVKLLNRLETNKYYYNSFEVQIMVENVNAPVPLSPARFLLPFTVPNWSKTLEKTLALDANLSDAIVADIKNEPTMSSALIALGNFYLNSRKEETKTGKTQ